MRSQYDLPQRWGARPVGNGLWQFGLWAPGAERITLHLGETRMEMEQADDGWHGLTTEARAGMSYGFERDGHVYPDPAARRQEGGVHGRSLLVDMGALSRHAEWAGRPWTNAVILEIHVGTFTRAGTLGAATREIGRLSDLGITAIELMPLAQFHGDRGWGYDGVLPYAVHPAYGTPDDLARFIAVAHEHGIMVLVDAVYNHFGPEGNPLSGLCPAFFNPDRQTPWGAAIDMEKPQVGAFFQQNAEMWLRDYGADGLRLDAVHQLGEHDSTAYLDALGAHLHGMELPHRIHLVAEDERNLVSYVRPAGPYEAQWNDDFHHCIHCLMTGERQSYYAPFAADPFGDLVTALSDGQVDQGQDRPAGAEPRGEPSGHVAPLRFVNSVQTHDQIGNRALGERLVSLAEPEAVQVCMAMLLLSPFVPMLFMGEEVGSRAPFLFFTDFDGDLAEAVRKGRRSEFPEFSDAPSDIPDPNAEHTFARSRPYDDLPADSAAWRELVQHLLAVRVDRILPLLDSGWRESACERLSDRSLRALWTFEDGRLELCFTMEGDPPWLSDTASEIFHMAKGNVAIRVGVST